MLVGLLRKFQSPSGNSILFNAWASNVRPQKDKSRFNPLPGIRSSSTLRMWRTEVPQVAGFNPLPGIRSSSTWRGSGATVLANGKFQSPSGNSILFNAYLFFLAAINLVVFQSPSGNSILFNRSLNLSGKSTTTAANSASYPCFPSTSALFHLLNGLFSSTSLRAKTHDQKVVRFNNCEDDFTIWRFDSVLRPKHYTDLVSQIKSRWHYFSGTLDGARARHQSLARRTPDHLDVSLLI